jgi:serine/threonine protein kinase
MLCCYTTAILQEWVPGGELFHHLDIEGSFSDATACFYAANVLLALECLHARGIVYRDLKPENLLLDTQVRAGGVSSISLAEVCLRCWCLATLLRCLQDDAAGSANDGRVFHFWMDVRWERV